MMPINLNKKRLALLDNSEHGQVQSDTCFEFYQRGDLITAHYHGGGIEEGRITGTLNGNEIQLVYHCRTKDKELKAGSASGIATLQNGKIHLLLDWQWLNGELSKGQSHYKEIE